MGAMTITLQKPLPYRNTGSTHTQSYCGQLFGGGATLINYRIGLKLLKNITLSFFYFYDH
jgi:hypothetical protein